MKQISIDNRELARELLSKSQISWKSFNNDMHWKIGTVDFWPTSLKWIDNKDGYKGLGITKLVSYLRIEYPLKVYSYEGIPVIKELSVQQIAKIFLKNEGKSLMEKCELLHKEIYD